MSDVWIIGSGMVRFGKYLDRSIKSLNREVVNGALADAELDANDLEAAYFANSNWGRSEGQYCIRGQVALRAMGIQSIPVLNVENACAGGSSALHNAWLSVRAGQYDCVLAVGVEKIYQSNKAMMLSAFLGGIDADQIPETLKRYQQAEAEVGISAQFPQAASSSAETLPSKKSRFAKWKRSLSLPKDSWELLQTGVVLGNSIGWKTLQTLMRHGGGMGAKGHSPFMDIYSLAARQHMKKYGTTIEQLATIAAKNHHHSSFNPLAQYQFDLSAEDVLADRPVSYPLTRSMCAPIGDGAAAAIVCSERFLKRHSATRAVRVLSSILASGRDRSLDEEDIGARAGRRAYELAAVGPKDIQLAELHDATAFGELHHCETLGFCGEGEGGPYALSGITALGGVKPINTSGGLESRGHPIAASGLAQIHELVMQLRGEADRRQVSEARVALAQNGGGAIGVEEAAMCIHILQGPS
jgi:acetyl-CoA acyltransferase